MGFQPVGIPLPREASIKKVISVMKGKTLIITGASLGIGRALALELAGLGVNLVLNARHQPALGDATAECTRLGVKVEQIQGNAAAAEVADAMVAKALQMGGLHGFIHAAGVLHPGPFLWELSPGQFREVLESHVVVAYQLVRAAVPPLLRQGEGLAVFFGSHAAVSNLPGLGVYNIAKAAEEHLARQLAQEAPRIVSFVFRPGVTETRMQEQARQAVGGAADIVQPHFQAYQRQGALDSPEDAARRLLQYLTDNPRRYHGRIVG
jgi:NAD(P)-dependent dehydrogenase (short-subunit alcohol dehydrogenase family)